MTSVLNPYLTFDGDARQALEFYQGVLGGELTMSTYGDGGETGESRDKIMHATLATHAGFTLMAGDVPPGLDYHRGENISISISGDDPGLLRGYWRGLSQDGVVTVPLEPQTWGDEFGMCVDKFGVPWMVDISQPEA